MTERELFDEIFSLHGNYQDDLLKSVGEKILLGHQHDLMTEKIADAITLILVFAHEKECGPVEVAREMASVVLHRLENSKDLDFDEVMMAAYLVGHANNPAKLAKRLLNKLTGYKDDPNYDSKRKGIKTAIHLNSLLFEIRSDKPCEDNFNFHYFALLKMYKSDKGVSAIYRSATLIRKGILDQEVSLVRQGLDALDDLSEKELVRLLISEVARYGLFRGKGFDKELYNFIMGRNVQKLRKAKGMSVDDLAKQMGVDIKVVVPIERGKADVSLYAAHIARHLEVSIGDIYEHIDFVNQLLNQLGPEKFEDQKPERPNVVVYDEVYKKLHDVRNKYRLFLT